MQRFARIGWIAVDEAEHALVRTLPDGIGGWHDAERFPCILLDLVNDGLVATRLGDFQLERAVDFEEAIIDRIAYQLAVDAHDPAADLQLQIGGNAVRDDFGDANHVASYDAGQPVKAAPQGRLLSNESYPKGDLSSTGNCPSRAFTC